eukprot:8705941-Pyramimonas_sp.AAC.1
MPPSPLAISQRNGKGFQVLGQGRLDPELRPRPPPWPATAPLPLPSQPSACIPPTAAAEGGTGAAPIAQALSQDDLRP